MTKKKTTEGEPLASKVKTPKPAAPKTKSKDSGAGKSVQKTENKVLPSKVKAKAPVKIKKTAEPRILKQESPESAAAAAKPKAHSQAAAAAPEIQKKTEKHLPPPEPPVQAPEPKTIPPAPSKTFEPKIKKEEAPLPLPPPPAPKAIRVQMPITVGNLAERLRVTVPSLIKTLMGLGIFANVNQLLNEEIVWKAAKALAIEIEKEEDEETKTVFSESEEQAKDLVLRPPVVTLMGHVDHGKTSLLDAIRKSNVAGREAGQITQHIGAYNVPIKDKGFVTFLDTPGHEAFTAMRARGANVTDAVVLVVAADDGVMPQTSEAIDHARAAEVPIVVAINKCDLPTADPNRVMNGLQKHGLMPEEWGGKTVCIKVSAKSGEGIDELLEMLLLESELLELKANPNRPAQGTVLDAKLTKNQGPVATLLVQRGTLKVGDMIVAGPYYGKARALHNDLGKVVKSASPSYAAEVLGLSGAPEAGEMFSVVSDEQVARKIAEKKLFELRERALKGNQSKHLSLEELYSRVREGRIKELKLILKADVQGSVEALTQALEQINAEQIKLRVIHGGVGSISESDIMLAAASDAIVIGFHVKPDDRALSVIEKEGVDVRLYHIIYEAIQDIQKAMEGLLEPTAKEVIEGRTEIRQIFSSSKIGSIGGAFVKKGRIIRNHPVRVLRSNIVVFQGKLASLKRFKDDVREVQESYDCGLVVESFNDLREGDVIESYRIEKVAGKLV